MLMAADNLVTADSLITEDNTVTPQESPVVRATDVDRAVELLAEADSLRTQAAELIGRVTDAGLAQWLGYVSMDRLIAHRTDCYNATARSFIAVARFLDHHPTSANSLRCGKLSWAKVQTLARVAVGDLAKVFVEYEADLLAAAEGCSPEEFDRLVHGWRSRVDAELDAEDSERSWRERSLTMQLAFDGSSRGQFRLDPIATEIVATALESPPDPTTIAEPRTLAQRRADALVNLCAADNNDSGGTRAVVDVVIDVETLAAANTCSAAETGPSTDAGTGRDSVTVGRLRRQLGRGGPISGPGLDRLLCDASFRALVTDGKPVVLAYNRATPDIPPALRRLVQIRDQRCTFTGCDRPHHWCDLHHIIPRNRGGPTTAENLTLLCRFHHGLVHEGGWQLTRAPDGTIQVSTP